MSQAIVITSGKGGVGKTTTTANLGVALARSGAKVVVVDADIGLRNLDVVMGLENRIVYDLVDVVEGYCRLRQALIKDKRVDGLFLLPAAQTKDKNAVNPDQMRELIAAERRARFHNSGLPCRDRTGIPERRIRSGPGRDSDDARGFGSKGRRPDNRSLRLRALKA